MQKINTAPTCAVDSTIDHNWVVARERGSRVRYRCTGCKRMTGWERVERTEVVNDCEPGEPIDAPAYEAMTVSALRDIAKSHGVTGYSKMKKSDLIAAITSKVDSKE